MTAMSDSTSSFVVTEPKPAVPQEVLDALVSPVFLEHLQKALRLSTPSTDDGSEAKAAISLDSATRSPIVSCSDLEEIDRDADILFEPEAAPHDTYYFADGLCLIKVSTTSTWLRTHKPESMCIRFKMSCFEFIRTSSPANLVTQSSMRRFMKASAMQASLNFATMPRSVLQRDLPRYSTTSTTGDITLYSVVCKYSTDVLTACTPISPLHLKFGSTF